MRRRSTFQVFAVAISILFCVVIAAEWKINKPNVWDEIAFSVPASASEAAEYLLLKSDSLNDAELNNLAKKIIETREIEFSRELANTLIYSTKQRSANKLAVLIAEQGFLLKNDLVLANRAALEYKMGRFVTKNYGKATAIFTNPILKDVPISKFYLAEILLDKENPHNDPRRAKVLLLESANAGITVAKSKLKEVM